MSNFSFSIHSIPIKVSLRSRTSVDHIFPILCALPRGDKGKAGWHIKASSGLSSGKTLPRPCPPSSLLRIWPNSWVTCSREEDGTFHASLAGAALQIKPGKKLAILRFRPDAVSSAEKLARLAIIEILRYEKFYVIHASAVEVDGGAVLICGPSGRGKSTLAASWSCLGKARFMADDLCVVFRKEEAIWAGGIYDSLGLSEESAVFLRDLGVTLPPAKTVLKRKTIYDCHNCFISICQNPYPVRAIIFLSDLGGDKPTIRQCEPEKASRLLLKSSFYVGAQSVMRDHFETVLDLVTHSKSYLIPKGMECRSILSQMEEKFDQHTLPAYPLYPLFHRRSVAISKKRVIKATKLLCDLASMPISLNKITTIGEDKWKDLAIMAEQHGMLELLAAILSDYDSFKYSFPQLDNLLETTLARSAAARQIHLTVLEALDSFFSSENISWITINGPSISERAYHLPEARYYNSLDILVEPAEWERTINSLESIGYMPLEKPPVRRRSRNGYGKVILRNLDTQYTINLFPACRDLSPRQIKSRGIIPQLLLNVQHIQADKVNIPVASLSDQIILSCLSAGNSRQSNNLLMLLDTALLIRLASRETLEVVVRSASRLGCSGLIKWVLSQAVNWFPACSSTRHNKALLLLYSLRYFGRVLYPRSIIFFPWGRLNRIRKSIFESL